MQGSIDGNRYENCWQLVRNRKNYALSTWLARIDTLTRSLVAFERNTTDSGFGFGLDLLLCLWSTIPVAKQEARFLNLLFEFLPSIHHEYWQDGNPMPFGRYYLESP